MKDDPFPQGWIILELNRSVLIKDLRLKRWMEYAVCYNGKIIAAFPNIALAQQYRDFKADQ